MNPLFQYFTKFNPLSKEAQKAIFEISSIVTIKRNTDLQPIGHTCQTIYFIKKGVARIYILKIELIFPGVSFLKTVQQPCMLLPNKAKECGLFGTSHQYKGPNGR